MAGFFNRLFGLFTRRYASTREPVATRFALDHEMSFRQDMRHQIAFGVSLVAVMTELTDLRHEVSFGTDLTHTVSFDSDLRHDITIRKRG